MNDPSNQNEMPGKAAVFRSRLLSTLILWAVVTGAFVSGSPWLFASLALFLGGCAVVEYNLMLREGGVPRQPFWGLMCPLFYLLVLFGFAGTGHFDRAGFLLWAAPVLAVGGAFVAVLKKEIDGRRTLTELGTTLVGFCYLGWLFGMSFFVLFHPLESGVEATFDQVPGAWLGLYVILVTKFTDMGAYLTGSLLGRHKMIPHISPGKTWEGAFGALIFAQLAGSLVYYFQADQLGCLGSWSWLIISNVLLAAMAILGDLAGSIIKRSLEVKDASHALPGIGGIFDLIDSICFTAPALLILIEARVWISNWIGS